jgi:hypothetical protein
MALALGAGRIRTSKLSFLLQYDGQEWFQAAAVHVL